MLRCNDCDMTSTSFQYSLLLHLPALMDWEGTWVEDVIEVCLSPSSALSSESTHNDHRAEWQVTPSHLCDLCHYVGTRVCLYRVIACASSDPGCRVSDGMNIVEDQQRKCRGSTAEPCSVNPLKWILRSTAQGLFVFCEINCKECTAENRNNNISCKYE